MEHALEHNPYKFIGRCTCGKWWLSLMSSPISVAEGEQTITEKWQDHVDDAVEMERRHKEDGQVHP